MLKVNSMIEERAKEVSRADILDPRHKDLLSQASRLENQIQKMIPNSRREEYRKLSDKLFDVEVQITSIESIECYNQGFKDGRVFC